MTNHFRAISLAMYHLTKDGIFMYIYSIFCSFGGDRKHNSFQLPVCDIQHASRIFPVLILLRTEKRCTAGLDEVLSML